MARVWLEKTNPSEYTADTRQIAWTILTSWGREGLLARSGIDLGPELARALEREAYGGALLAMAGYVPRLAEVNTRPEAARAVVAHWEAHSRDGDWDFCLAAWVGRWNLMRAGVLTAEEQGRFGSDYVDAVKFELEVFEPEVTALLTLAQITPPGTFPLATWAGRLSDQDDRCRLAAQLAIHGWLVDMAGGGQRVASSEQGVASSDQPLATRHSLLNHSPCPPASREWPDRLPDDRHHPGLTTSGSRLLGEMSPVELSGPAPAIHPGYSPPGWPPHNQRQTGPAPRLSGPRPAAGSSAPPRPYDGFANCHSD